MRESERERERERKKKRRRRKRRDLFNVAGVWSGSYVHPPSSCL